MRILVDENIPQMTVEALRQSGHDVKDVRGTAEEGIDDERIWDIVKREDRFLITTDKGFSVHRGERHPGVLIVRLRQPNRLRIHQRVMQGLRHFPEVQWPGRIMMIRDTVQSVWECRREG
ncbi:MAG TPA: DUF5615 family PIN-like protein [Candidatus Hydrogenedentes bacterium]|nr:DUF5615 family PIN-like protein [Candidatus Hydrogenedentota bacterium]